MLQCPQLADSCLALGQAACRRARELTHQYAAEGVQSSVPVFKIQWPGLIWRQSFCQTLWAWPHILVIPITLAAEASSCAVIFAGKLGEVGRTARVIYAQTDSIFMHVPDANAAQAIDVGKQTAKLVSAAFPKPMELKFENVSWPFMLLHVNRCPALPFSVHCQTPETAHATTHLDLHSS